MASIRVESNASIMCCMQSVRPAALFRCVCKCNTVGLLFWKSSTQSKNLLAETAGLGAEEKNVVSNADVHPRCSRVRGQRGNKRDCIFFLVPIGG